MNDIGLYLPGFIVAYAILIVGASSPGPSVALVVGIATAQGRAMAMMATLGIAFGSMTINVVTMLGVGLLLSQAVWVMGVLRLVGAAYLLFLAWVAFKKAVKPPKIEANEAMGRSPLRHFIVAYLLQVSNPKAIAFWLSIASIGAVNNGNGVVIGLFVLGAFIISFVCHGVWAFALSVPSARRAYNAGRCWIEMALGGFFVFAAYNLATTED